MENERVIQVLTQLVETSRDGQRGYREAAENIENPELRAFFNDQSIERARFAGELESQIERLGEGDIKEIGSVGSALHRAWMGLKSSLGGGDHAILNSVESGEDAAKEAYEKALHEPLPNNIMLIVQRQAASVVAAHDHVKALRDRRKAA
jgi:uncharacterized protein (TIGR02284 family)